MVIIDERGGSAGIEGAKRRLSALRSEGVDADLGRLEYGDYAIAGNGPEGTTIMVGVELKTTRDILSSLRSNRLMGHQIPGMVGADGNPGMYDRAWLLTEGIWRANREGDFECYLGSWQTFSSGSRRIGMSDLERWILSTIQTGGLSYWHCALQTDTARFISNLHHWWTSKDYEEHRNHQVIYHKPPDRALFTTPSDFATMVADIPKVGWTRAMAIERAAGEHGDGFETLMSMPVKRLQEIDGIGKGIADIIWRVLHGNRPKAE